MRKQKMPEAIREKMVAQFEKKAIEAYSKIITRYPAMERAGDAKRRLQALNAPVPEPTPEALAENKAEEQSREKMKLVARVTGNFKKHPNVAIASKVGEPNLNDEVVKSAPEMVNGLTAQINGMQQPAAAQPTTAAPSGQQATHGVGVEAIGTGNGTTAPNENVPGSANPTPPAGNTGTAPNGNATAKTAATPNPATSTEGTPPPQAPAQVNEIQKPTGEGVDVTKPPASGTQKSDKVDKKSESSSKKKKKKGLGKLNPF